MTEDEAWSAVETYLAAINAERKFIDPLYKPLGGVVRAFQKAPRPKGPYALVTLIGTIDNGEADHFCYSQAKILSRSRDATDEELRQAPVATEARVRSYTTKLRIDVFADRALDYASVLRSAFQSSRASSDLQGLVPQDIGNIEFVPENIGETFEGRARFEIELTHLHSIHNAIDVIENGYIGITAIGTTTIETDLNFQKE